MYDISKRKELKNATVDDILKILQELPKDSKVFFNGDEHGYIHMEKDLSVVSFDDCDLEDDYYYNNQIDYDLDISELHKKCYKVNHGDSERICDGCSSQEICLLIKEQKGE